MAEPNNTRASTPVPEDDGKVTYHGNCHCGAFKFSLVSYPLKMVGDAAENHAAAAECNCSICQKKGYLWTMAAPDALTIDHGTIEDTLQSYEWNTGTTLHKFCPTCGTPVMAIRPHAPPGKSHNINIRTFYPSIDIDNLALNHYPGWKIMEPEYKPVAFEDHGLQVSEDEKTQNFKVYTGSCHCGKVKVAVKTKALDGGEADIKGDDCSICTRNALQFVYPTPHQELVRYSGEENLTTYFFGNKFNGHRFCKTCGIQVDIDAIGPPGIRERLSQFPEEKRKMILRNLNIRPVNLRVFDEWVLRGGEKGWGLDKLIKKSRGEGADYVV